VLFLINNMYVNPQLANYIHTRSAPDKQRICVYYAI